MRTIYKSSIALFMMGLFTAMSPISGQMAQNYSLNIVNDPIIGPHLVDSNGYSLYIFTKDPFGNSTCTGQCAANWPPYYAGDNPTIPSGLSKSNLGTINRTDGVRQTTYMGRPLYRFFGEPSTGTARGDGVGGVWYVARPDGSVRALSNSTAGMAANATNMSNTSIASRAASSIYNRVANATGSVTNRTGY